jgi:hypothetical protein
MIQNGIPDQIDVASAKVSAVAIRMNATDERRSGRERVTGKVAGVWSAASAFCKVCWRQIHSHLDFFCRLSGGRVFCDATAHAKCILLVITEHDCGQCQYVRYLQSDRALVPCRSLQTGISGWELIEDKREGLTSNSL